jgi:N-acyl-D-aspartate/D-glutamate deacylase
MKGLAMADYELIIRSGLVVDGDGGEPFEGDVAIDGGVIAAVGDISGRGDREIDAEGAVVAPGFVDVHTHYDGQATWDARLQPSSWHGVTTVVMGNCGVGFAPVQAPNRDRLVELMEGVEDIPGSALREGLTWDWQSFPDYLNVLAQRRYDVDLAAQVPHAALRVEVMGERAAAHVQATPEEGAEMARLAAEAVLAGALGFTTSRTLNHRSVNGELTPSYGTGEDEIVAIARAVGQTGRAVMQVVSDFTELDAEFALLREAMRVGGMPLSVSLLQSNLAPDGYRDILDFVTDSQHEGLSIRAQVAPRPVGMLLGLRNTLHPFMENPVWQRLAGLTAAEQAPMMRADGLRAEILAVHTRAKNRQRLGGGLIHKYELMYEVSDPPVYEPDPSQSIAARAARRGVSPEELAYDIMAAGDGVAMLYLTFANYARGNLDAVREMLEHPYTIPGLSDGGAHVGTICDGSFPTTLLAHWARDRGEAGLGLPFVVQRQARDTARAVGLRDRGVIGAGYRADVNVIDMAALRLHRPEIVFDLPAGGRRLLQRADGYRHTIVAGQETYRDGSPTGALPGRLIRGPQGAPRVNGTSERSPAA